MKDAPIDKLFIKELLNALALMAFAFAVLAVLAGVRW